MSARHRSFEHVATATVEAFLRDEVPPGLSPVATPRIGGTGTVAPHALASPLLLRQLEAQGVAAAICPAADDPAALLADRSWTLALVLSPHKQDVGRRCDHLMPSAAATGVVDTLRRDGDTVLGCNTNSAAAATAVDLLVGDGPVQRVLVAGTGASTRSVAIGLRRRFPAADLGVWGRSPARLAALVAEVPDVAAVADPGAWGADVVVNATTVGETDDDVPEDFALLPALRPGVRFFDLNNRTGRLQRIALAAGSITAAGICMQLTTNALRVALLTGRVDGHDRDDTMTVGTPCSCS